MSYIINVAKDGHHLFATRPESIRSASDLQRVLPLMVAQNPEKHGYSISVTYEETTGFELDMDALMVVHKSNARSAQAFREELDRQLHPKIAVPKFSEGDKLIYKGQTTEFLRYNCRVTVERTFDPREYDCFTVPCYFVSRHLCGSHPVAETFLREVK